ncbi:MAG: protein kinase [Chloroflexi bacterium]|nr:protein kinase [Chloroflexota bacterium]
MSNLIGQSLGRYHILEQLGEGGMATVYKAFDTRLERDVAIKIIRKSAFGAEILEKVLARFEREAKSLAKLSHPNIVKVHDFGDHEGSPYLVMEYLPGGTLKQSMGKPIAWDAAIHLLLPVARGLAYAHQRNIIHRDVKPANILITESGEPMLSDFGIAKLLENEDAKTLTGTGVGIGTPEYMAPEQGMGSTVDARADIYSLGIVLYEMVTGRKPYTADTPMAVVLKQMADPLPRPSVINREVPASVERILFKALAKKPHDRYESMNDFIQALETCLGGRRSGTKNLSLDNSAKQVDDQKTIDQVIVQPKSKSFGKSWWLLALALCVIAVIAAGILGWPGLATLAEKSIPTRSLEKTNLTSLPVIIRTPFPTATNIPAGTVLFSENFEAGVTHSSIRNVSGNWKVSADSTNKVYEMDNEKSPDYPGFDLGSSAWTNYEVEYRVKILRKSSLGAVVILYFRQNYDGGLDGYVQTLMPDWGGYVTLAKHVNGWSWQNQKDYSYTFALGQWYHVRVQAVGSSLKVFIDNKLIIETTDPQFNSGSLTFQAGPGAYIMLDDIIVKALEP